MVSRRNLFKAAAALPLAPIAAAAPALPYSVPARVLLGDPVRWSKAVSGVAGEFSPFPLVPQVYPEVIDRFLPNCGRWLNPVIADDYSEHYHGA